MNFRPAITSEAKPLIGLYAESGAGKTFSALLLAKGFAGDMSKVGMIETESGRGEVFADDPVIGGYQVRPIRENFSPAEYGKAISDAEKAGLRVLIIDSASHEWEGAGGVLGMAAKNQEDGKKGPLVWQRPKMDHQREFMLRLMQTPIPLVIVCMRAKYPMEEVVQNGKKEWTRSKELSPKQSEDILFEMMVHAWIDKEHRLHVTKWTKDAFKAVFLDNEPITAETGRRLAAWAAGSKAKESAPPATPRPVAGTPPERGAGQEGADHVAGDGKVIEPSERAALMVKAQEFAECGTDKYKEWWVALGASKQKIILDKHEEMKAIAAKVPT